MIGCCSAVFLQVTLDEFIVAITTKEELRFIGDMFKWKSVCLCLLPAAVRLATEIHFSTG